MTLKIYFPSIDIPRPVTLGGSQWQLKNLQPITVLFGKNSSGKSLLLRAWRDLQVGTSHYVVPERTGNLGFNPNYLQQQIDPKHRRDQSSRNFDNEYRQQVIARVQAYFGARGASRSDKLPGNVDEVESYLSALLPDFSIELLFDNPPYKLRRAENQQEVGDVDQLSSGEAQLLTIGLDILTIAAIWDVQNTSSRLLLVDEPDAHIHPDLQARFADFLTQVGNRYDLQVVVATHSTTLLSALGQFGGNDCGVIYLDRTKTEFKAQLFTATLKEVSACLGGNALMGPLFNVPLLLVEGDDDYRVWSQVPRHHIVSFAVIPCNGEEIRHYQATLEKIFLSLREKTIKPVGYALLDGDKSIPQPQPHATQDHIKFIGLQCREAENLYLVDEVLSLIGIDWESASQAIMTASVQHGNKAKKLATACNWDRQYEDIKDLICEISRAIDPKNVHWTQRLGEAIGQRKPSGQLAKFLGQEVIEALWT
jgi:predicted ATPase